MEKRGLSIVAIALALCLGCTETFSPSGGDDPDSLNSDGVIGAELPGDDIPGLDFTGSDGGADLHGLDTPGPDSIQPAMGPVFRIWITGGASISTNNEVRVIGGIRPGDGIPSGDGVYWLLPVFRAGPAAK